MIRIALALALSTFGLGVFFPGRAAAEPIPVAWSYRKPFNEITFPIGATGGLTFPNTEFQSFTSDQTILASKISSYSVARDSEPDLLLAQTYGFTLDIRDDASGEIARLQYQGNISGEFWRTGTNLSNEFRGESMQTATLGGNLYTVSLGDFQSPTGYGDSQAGGFYANVRINEASESTTIPNVSPNVTPEPATLILAGVGLAGTGFLRIRRRNASTCA
ncbi:hypothetical protein BH11PLA2_BH11PLA2_31760 [soil metagenome]